ncbi:cytochrome P450 [Cucurbitaria berberidis CBS 394.84]|uniref:Cytochrome P450 n=1 Tax=Cucurbitaria berberidis CBS 394.84 TaxID=1168544 RepID=A0A9P4G9I3_9PLEO|nr:cytochrome P450 [Cucurbitaria berberidis CBS 394.84]KAF1841638.1 cytochrome P450 [Cucurbitaria berberidis CBS 394.84]
MGLLSDHAIVFTLASLLVAWLGAKVFRVVMERRKFRKLPGPPCNLFLGHLIPMGKIAMKHPQRVHPHVLVANLMREYNLPSVFYLDNRPAAEYPVLVVADPEVAREISESGLPKHRTLLETIEPLAGRLNILSIEGQLWKKWRNVFNPGFSVQQVISQVPVIVECTEAFINILDRHASKDEVFRLEEETTKISIDVIGRVVCDHDFKTLTTDNDFMRTMRKTLSWMPNQQSMNPWHRNHPLRPIMWKYYKRQMDNYIGKVLDERFAVRDTGVPKKAKIRTGIDLALAEYFKENGQDADSHNATVMDAEFRRFAIDNLLILLFAGHDTTASTICYCYHMLHKHPHILAKLRQELDDVFGAGVSATQQLKDSPYLINKCEYTLAVIKEVLRLWPPASGVRSGQKGHFIKDPASGEMLPTEGCIIWTVSMCLGRSAKIWGSDVDVFRPERFLPENADKIPLNAWRPFEKGPRNCIGQELALVEMKVVLALTVREFDIRAAYDELDALSNDGSLWARDSSFRKGPQKAFGDEMYQILLAAGKPREATTVVAANGTVDLGWHAPKKSWINDLGQVLNGTGTNGFVFGGSELPKGVKYGTYNWCNMPHVRKEEYPVAAKEYDLVYVEVIHRHHKRTPYASNTFLKESYNWECANQGLFYYGQPLNPSGNKSSSTYWSVYSSDVNPFPKSGFQGSCQFPQITREGLDDSWQHGKDLYGVYRDQLRFLPKNINDKVSFRVTNNVITSQVAGMLVDGMFSPKRDVPLRIQPSGVDSLEPQYTCPKASSLSSSYGVGSTAANWTAHLTATKPLFSSLDSISGVASDSTEWHRSFDHYYDNLSARQCHAKPLPCKLNDTTSCVTQEQANTVYRLGQYEYSFLYRDSPQSLQASIGSYGVFLAELAQNMRDAASGKSPVIYRHNVAHDGSVSRLLSILQIDQMVWVGMGSEVVFEIYQKKQKGGDYVADKKFIRILWGGQVLVSSNPSLGKVDMLDLDVFLGYVDGLVGSKAENVVAFCKS